MLFRMWVKALDGKRSSGANETEKKPPLSATTAPYFFTARSVPRYDLQGGNDSVGLRSIEEQRPGDRRHVSEDSALVIDPLPKGRKGQKEENSKESHGQLYPRGAA